MDFSQNVLIEFGFNVAGYAIVLALLMLLLRNRQQRTTATKEIPVMEKANFAVPIAGNEKASPEVQSAFVAFEKNNSSRVFTKSLNETPVAREYSLQDKQKNRRDIYKEARRLLAQGTGDNAILNRLPLTEGELEMISAVGKA